MNENVRKEPAMSDIVERLVRFEASDALGNGDFSVCIQAANIITRLRAELAEARAKAIEEAPMEGVGG